jgi:hypothetical protein
MLTYTEVTIPTVLVILVIDGYLIWKFRRTRSKPPAAPIESVETSEFGRGTLITSRCLVGILIAIIGLTAWNDHGLFNGPRPNAWLWLLVVSSLIGLSWYVLGLAMRSSARSLSFDEDGLWRTQAGKEQGLVRWPDICRVKERSSALQLFDRDGRPMLKVEYERDGYLRIRSLIMERMSFDPPSLPFVVSAPGRSVGSLGRIAFACAALLSLTICILSSSSRNPHILVAVFLCCAVGFGIMAIPPPKIIIDAESIRAGRREYPYSSIRSVEASFLRTGMRWTPNLTLDVGMNRPAIILAKGLPIDTLTLQRCILGALSKARK